MLMTINLQDLLLLDGSHSATPKNSSMSGVSWGKGVELPRKVLALRHS